MASTSSVSPFPSKDTLNNFIKDVKAKIDELADEKCDKYYVFLSGDSRVSYLIQGNIYHVLRVLHDKMVYFLSFTTQWFYENITSDKYHEGHVFSCIDEDIENSFNNGELHCFVKENILLYNSSSTEKKDETYGKYIHETLEEYVKKYHDSLSPEKKDEYQKKLPDLVSCVLDATKNKEIEEIKKLLNIKEGVDYSDPKNVATLRYANCLVELESESESSSLVNLPPEGKLTKEKETKETKESKIATPSCKKCAFSSPDISLTTGLCIGCARKESGKIKCADCGFHILNRGAFCCEGKDYCHMCFTLRCNEGEPKIKCANCGFRCPVEDTKLIEGNNYCKKCSKFKEEKESGKTKCEHCEFRRCFIKNMFDIDGKNYCEKCYDYLKNKKTQSQLQSKTCPYTFARGAKRGEKCGLNTLPDLDYCGSHTKIKNPQIFSLPALGDKIDKCLKCKIVIPSSLSKYCKTCHNVLQSQVKVNTKSEKIGCETCKCYLSLFYFDEGEKKYCEQCFVKK